MRINLFIIFIFFCLNLFPQSEVKLEKTETFFPDWRELREESIDWYYLSVPENYDDQDGKKIKLAVTVLHSTSKTKSNPLIFIQGGPGGSTIGGLWRWLEHPMRKTGDIILIDIRGTGFSEPTMCPNLGKNFFKVLSKNQSKVQDEKEKVKLSIACQQELIDKGIDVNSYNSTSVSKDLNTLKKVLKIDQWNVYGVSYGTFLSQEYAKRFPNDIKSLILDSSINDISKYYNKNTSNYLDSLNKLFKECKNNVQCNKAYPDLENVYFSVIENLEKNPVTVKVDENILSTGKFTYNVEDFKIAIHQSLYQKEMIEVLPLLIYQFHERNENSLSALVGAFSGALSLDYGTYYCFTCKDAIPNNSIDDFNNDAYININMQGGLSFYKSDYDVCKAWNKRASINNEVSNYSKDNKFPVLIFSGNFDPITPTSFAKQTATNYNNSKVIFAKTFGHIPSFSKTGNTIINDFINSENNNVGFKKNKVNFITSVFINKGVYNFGNDINNFDWILFTPLFVGVFVLFSFAFYFLAEFRNNKFNVLNIALLITTLLTLLSIIFLSYSVYDASEINFYILAFGLLKKYSFIFYILKLSTFCSLFSLLYFIVSFMKINDPQYYILVLFSLLVLNTYYVYWGFLF